MKTPTLLTGTFLATSFLANLAQAADITWQTPQAISSALDVNTQGTLYTAKSSGYGYTVNGVFFDPAAANFSESFERGDAGYMGGQTFIGTNNADGQAYAGLMDFAHAFNGWGNATATITFSNLTVGQQYLVQYWVADYRTPSWANPDRYLTLTGGANTSGQLRYMDADNTYGIHGSYVIGTFTADATSQAIGINSNESTMMQAVQLRTNFAFTDADGIWTGADGNWSTAANWQGNAVAHGIDKSATFNGLTPVTATVDAGHPIGALNFSGANHTIAAGAGSLNLDIDTVFTSPTVTVAAGITATIGSQLTGNEGLTKAGTGTLVLSGSRIYTGTTNVTAGTLQYQGGTYASGLHSIATGAVLDFNVSSGTFDGASTTFDGAGTLRKTGAGTLWWPATIATFAFEPGALIDVQEGIFAAGSYGNESWSGNLSDLNVASTATFTTVEANVRVNKITGSGTIATGYSGAGYQNLTIGVDNGSSSFGGVITDSLAPGNLVKVGTGTINLTGASTYTGTTSVTDGTLSLAQAFLNNDAAVVIGVDGTLDLGFSGTDVVGSLTIEGTELTPGVYNASTHPGRLAGSGSLEVLGGNGTWASLVNGDWGGASNWSGNSVASGIDSIATFSAATGVTVNLDSNRTIGGLVFGTTGYTLAGSSTLTFNTTSPGIPTITVDSGLAATVSAKLGGTAGLVKNGAGTLSLSAGAGDNYGIVYNQNISGGLNITQGTVEFTSQYIRMGSITIGSGATLRSTFPWATGSSSNFGLNGASAGSFTVEAGGTLTSTTLANALIEGLTLNGGSVTAPGVTDGSWGAFIIASSVTADGATTSSISAELALAGNQTFEVLAGSTLDVTGVIHNRAGTAGAINKFGDGTLTLGGANTYSGNTVVDEGTLNVTGTLSFYPGASGSTNSVSGSATLSYSGTVDLELGGADATPGNSWNLFSLGGFSSATLNPAAVTSTLGAFSEVSAGTWELPVTSAKWVFTEADGNLAYVNAASPYETWGSTYGLGAGTEAGDLDNDGLTNFQEFAFGLIPNNGSSVNPITSQLNKTTGQFTYQRLNGSGLTYTIWTSPDLVTWTEDTTAGQSVTTGTPNDSVVVTLTGPLPADKLFVRVQAQ